MIRIGVVNIDVSHPKAFSDYLAQDNRARYVAVYNDGFRSDAEVDAFVGSCGLEKRCASLEELADCVDVGFIQGCNWDKHLGYALHFFERDKPVFIDKPIAGLLSDCLALEKYAAEGKHIFGTSALRYARELVDFRGKPVSERGEMMNIFGTAGVDEYNYAIHVVEGIGGLIDAEARSAQFVGRSGNMGLVCETYYIRYGAGLTAMYNTFQGTWMPFHFVVMTTTGTHAIDIETSGIYGALLDRICTAMEGGGNELAGVSKLTESVKIMLAARISREKGGTEIALSDIPVDDPGYDGDAFEKTYAANAKNIYLPK